MKLCANTLSKELDRKVDKWVYQGLLFKIS